MSDSARRRWVRALAGAGLLAPIVAVGLAPLAWMMVKAIGGAAFSRALAQGAQWGLLGRTVGLAFSVAALATLLGTAAGYRLGATAWPGKGVARAVLILPLAIPPYLHAIGWATLLRPGGWIAAALHAGFGLPPSVLSEGVYSFLGAVVVLALGYFPIAMLFCEKSLAYSSPSLWEAAVVFGASPLGAFSVARWPFMRPAVASSAMITFLLAASELGVPTILKVPVFNFEVFTQLSAFNDMPAATLLVIPLLVVGLLVLVVERRFMVGDLVQPDVQDIQPPRPATAGELGRNVVFFAVLSVVVIGLPVGAIVLQGADAEAFAAMLRLARTPILNTLKYAVSAAMIITLGAFVLAWLLRDARTWRRHLNDMVLLTGFAVPSTIMALALLGLYDRPGVSRWIGATSLVVAALVVRYAIIGYRILAAAVNQIPDELFEAAALDGADATRTTRHVLVPMLRVSLLATFAVALVFAIGEIGSTILLYPPGGETLPIALYAIEANSPRAYVAALTIIQLLVSLALLGALALLIGLVRHRTYR